MKKKLIIVGILLLIAASVGFFVIKNMYKKAERNVATEQAITINPIEFATLYKNAEDSANKLYLNKIIQLTGVVANVTSDTTNQTEILIKINDSLPLFNCNIDGLQKSISIADTITIKGINTGILTNINFNNCLLINNKKYNAITSIVNQSEKTIAIIDTPKKELVEPKALLKPSIFKTSKAQITFDAGGGLEDIKASNNQVEATIDTLGNINFKAAMLQFKFADALMQQHFNEEYVESTKFPTAKFTGNIINKKDVNINQNGTYNANIKGQLTIHGITKAVQTTAQLMVKDGKIKAISTLKIILADYAVKSAAAEEAVLKITANF